ncbi:serine protease [uncultured Nostoc sp.]|uniref:S1 family peptidase n=1 Tax=uncultured Nostoc sp. TaxID=340711 RepID=UPI0035CC2B5F
MATQQDNLTPGIVRILKPDGKTAGTGFIVTKDGLIVTCAHVVEYAKAEPGGTVSLVFYARQQTYIGRVDEKYWSASTVGDIAILHLEGNLPNEVKPLQLGTSSGSSGHAFKTFGFPEAKPLEGMYGYGTIGDLMSGENGLPLVQLTNATEVTPGFSGAPVVDERTHRVVGMVTAITPVDKYQRQAETAFITPSEFLQEIFPALEITNICPYVGLEAFTKDKANFFFGREALVVELANHLKNNPQFLAIVGSSGSGKSSVVQAGLLPYLEQVKLPGFNKICTVSYRYTAYIANPSDDFHGYLQKYGIFNIEDTNSRIIIFIDQFEEIFALCPEPEQSNFLNSLTELVDQKLFQNNKITLIIAVRADFYDPLLRSPLGHFLGVGQVNITPLKETELREAIAKPAAQVGLEIESGLDERIIEDIGATQNPLPLLEFTLEQLCKNEHSNGRLTHVDYEKIGKVTGAIGQWANETYRNLDEKEQLITKRIFTRLIHYGEGTIPDTRRRLPIFQLLTTNDEQLTRQVIKTLADQRLIVTDAETVDIIHEALLREWSDLRIWIREQRSFLLWRQRLDERRTEWINNKKDQGLLLRGLSLLEAKKWLQKPEVDLNLDEQAFIKESTKLWQIEQFRLWAGIGSVVSLIIGGVVIFITQQNQKQLDLLDAWAGVSQIDNNIETLQKLFEEADKYKKVADKKSQNQINTKWDKDEDLMRAFSYYVTIQSTANKMLGETSKNQIKIKKSDLEKIKSIMAEAEKKRVEMIHSHLRPVLIQRLDAKNYGTYLSSNEDDPVDGENLYTKESALQETYKIMFKTGADLNRDQKIDTQEEANLIPSKTLLEIENVWLNKTGNYCGWCNPCVGSGVGSEPHQLGKTYSIKQILFFSLTSFVDDRFKSVMGDRCPLD